MPSYHSLSMSIKFNTEFPNRKTFTDYKILSFSLKEAMPFYLVRLSFLFFSFFSPGTKCLKGGIIEILI